MPSLKKSAALLVIAVTYCVGVITNSRAYASDTDVIAYGDWPPTNFCNEHFSLKKNPDGSPARQLVSWACNDKTSGVHVPWGRSLMVCENDGVGDAGLGRCRHFLPGDHFVGWDFNDVATSFFVNDQMVGYLNSADFPVDFQIQISVKANFDPGFQLEPAKIGFPNTPHWVTHVQDIPLPPGCSVPDSELPRTTANGEYREQHRTLNGRLLLMLAVRNRTTFGGNNWIGVELSCKKK